MKGKIVLAFSILMLSIGALADDVAKPLMRCGPFTLSSSHDGFMHINDVRPETQKFSFLGDKDDYSKVKYQWMVPTNTPGKWYGMDYVKKNGKAILNVQLVQANMNAPRVYGTYDCVKVK